MRDELRTVMLGSSDANALRDQAIAFGMETLWQDGWGKVAKGVTTRDELLRVTQES